MSPVVEYASGNCLLAALPREEHDKLRPFLRETELRRGEILLEAGEAFELICFPSRAVVSLVSAMDDGTVVETATIGREGAFGFAALFGGTVAMARYVVQMPGAASLIPRSRIQRLTDADGGMRTLRSLFDAWGQAFVAQVLQSVACNAAHTVEQRLCRSLLMAHDRHGDDALPLTQELLAQMLGVRRASVTQAAGSLQERGLIRYRRGMIRILDRTGLERHCCECYGTVRNIHTRLLPFTYG